MKVPVRPTPALSVEHTKTNKERRGQDNISSFVVSYKIVSTQNVSLCVFVKPAVDHCRRVSGVLVHVLSDQMSKADEELGGFWDPVIRPGCEVEVTN